MIQRINSVGWQPHVNKMRTEQVAQRSTWSQVPDREKTNAAMHVIHTVPNNGSTTTYVNPMDCATVGNWSDYTYSNWGTVKPAGRWYHS